MGISLEPLWTRTNNTPATAKVNAVIIAVGKPWDNVEWGKEIWDNNCPVKNENSVNEVTSLSH